MVIILLFPFDSLLNYQVSKTVLLIFYVDWLDEGKCLEQAEGSRSQA